jgi:hypothetical protein
LNRVTRLFDEPEDDAEAEMLVSVGEALIRDSASGDGLGKLARHEATLMNAFTKTLQMLLLIQENRDNRPADAVMIGTVALAPN